MNPILPWMFGASAVLSLVVGLVVLVGSTVASRTRWTLAAALVAAAAVAWSVQLQSPFRYQPNGHEHVWVDVSRGLLDPADAGKEFAIPAFPRGLATVLAAAPPSLHDDSSRWAREGNSVVLWIWIGLNRLGLFAWILGLGLTAARLWGPRATLVGALAAASIPAAAAWSTTVYGPMVGAGLATLGLLAGAHGRRGTALFLSAAAYSVRPEVAAIGIAAVLLPQGPLLLERRTERVAAALGVAIGLLLLAARAGGGLGGLELTSRLLGMNIRALALGTPLFSWVTLAAIGVLVGSAVRAGVRPPPRVSLAFGLAFTAAVGSLLLPVDVGARHFLPASTLAIIPLIGLSGGLWKTGTGAARAVAAAWLIAMMLVGGRAHVEQRVRLNRDALGMDPAWVAAADLGVTRTPEELVDTDCVLSFPAPTSVQGALQSSDPVNLVSVMGSRDAGRCVLMAVGPQETLFRSEGRAERFDRARLLFGLRPVGWVSPTSDGSGRWMLWRGEPGRSARDR